MRTTSAILASVASAIVFASSPAVFAADSSGGATDAAAQAAACETAATPSAGGVAGTNTGTGSGATGTSTSALTASDSSDSAAYGTHPDGPSSLNCPGCPEDIAGAVTQILSSEDPTNTSTVANSPVCDPALDAFCISTSDPDEGSGNPLTPVTRLLPSQGIIAIGTKNPLDVQPPTSPTGLPIYPFYLFYDGYPGTISPLGGYIGINGFDVDYALLGLVASTDPADNFNRLGGNVPLIGNILASLILMTDQEEWAAATQDISQLVPGLSSQGTGPSPICDPNDLICLSTHDPLEGTGNPLAPLTRILPTQGIIALGPYNQDTGETLIFTPEGIDLSALYLFFDGEPYNIDPLGGYVGLAGADFNSALLGLVLSLKNIDNFNRAGGNLPIIGYPSSPLTSLTPLLYHIAVVP